MTSGDKHTPEDGELGETLTNDYNRLLHTARRLDSTQRTGNQRLASRIARRS